LALRDAMVVAEKEGYGCPGGWISTKKILDTYLDRLVEDFRPGRHVKVVMDCGNGAAGTVARELLQRLSNVSGEVLFDKVDGRFPNHHPDPTIPENLVDLRARMEATGAELGIAFDGDGDRIGALNDKQEIVWGDRMMILFSREILKERPGATVIGDVKCSQVLFDAVKEAGRWQAADVEDRPLPGQGQDEGDRGAFGRRDERTSFLRRPLSGL
ncbi:MAG: hypothetical protein HQL50_15245, partial [Magnetococcales bacterium]|nr:hypothetical protein [Magnetococcales bacterium]